MHAVALLCLLAQEPRPFRLPYEEGATWLVGQGGMSNGTHRNKWAYDIMMPEGTRVHASRAGVVVAVKQDTPDPPPGKPGTGEPNWVVIDHGDGTEAQYVHIKQNGAVVKAGDKVEQGQFVCLSGNTGVSPVPHLHLEMKKRNGPSFEPAFEDVDGDGKLAEGKKYASGNIPGVPVAVKDKLSSLARVARLAEQEGAWGFAYIAWKRFADEKLPVKVARQEEARKRLDAILAQAEGVVAQEHAADACYRIKLAYQGIPLKALEGIRKPETHESWEDFYRALKLELEGKLPAARSAYKNLLSDKPDEDLRRKAERRLAEVESRLKELATRKPVK